MKGWLVCVRTINQRLLAIAGDYLLLYRQHLLRLATPASLFSCKPQTFPWIHIYIIKVIRFHIRCSLSEWAHPIRSQLSLHVSVCLSFLHAHSAPVMSIPEPRQHSIISIWLEEEIPKSCQVSFLTYFDILASWSTLKKQHPDMFPKCRSQGKRFGATTEVNSWD